MITTEDVPEDSGGTISGAVVAEVAAAVLDVAPLLRALGDTQRVHLPPGPGDPAQSVLTEATGVLGLPDLVVTASPDGHSAAELIIGRRLGRSHPGQAGPGEIGPALNRSGRRSTSIRTEDGSLLTCYASGSAEARPVVLVTACGMPDGLLHRWTTRLSQRHRVISWESRGLFDQLDPDDGFDDRGQDLDAQAGDVLSVLEAQNLHDAHLVGLCGGAPVALLAAGRSSRVTSLSLWHGDYELGPTVAKTRHQQDMQLLLAQAGRGRDKARGLHQVFRRPSTLAALRADLAHHLYYPYATPELLYRYGRLNGAIMTTDCRPLLTGVTQPTLVVTSPEDTTAHPDGSHYVAAGLPAARLAEMPHGDHLSAFDAGPEVLDLAENFLDTVHGVRR